MSNLIPFQFESNEIRTVVENGEAWVVAKDVAEALEYKWVGTATIKHVPEKWRGVRSVHTPSGIQEMAVLHEQGLYFFLARSDKPKALPFQEWLAGEVVPSIRKTGKYETPKAKQKSPRLASVISAHKSLAQLSIDIGGVRPGIAAACALGMIELDTGIDTEPYRRLLPGITETVEALNATALGRLVGKTAKETNRLLADMGLQERNERGEWSLTEKGKEYGAAYPFAKNGHSSHQILWLPNAAKLLGH
jgi:prophage antirepressor-like protein